MTIAKEEAIRQLRRSTVTLSYYAVSWDHYKDAGYKFDFSESVWTRKMLGLGIYAPKETGEISKDIAERFFERIWFASQVPDELRNSESERSVPATPEERDFLKSDTKKLAQYSAGIFGKYFTWLPEVDTSEPYCKLTAAFAELLAELELDI